ncbi:MAG: prevent-host-death protein [Coriobacteriales bacterium]|nr:prevent-host-death protein [Coriobacteriales bacterium]
MPTIDKVSSLRNYQAVLGKVRPGNPVFLTKNGAGRYAILDTAEYDFLYKAAFDKLFKQLDSARTQADRDGWVSEEALREHFGIATDA